MKAELQQRRERFEAWYLQLQVRERVLVVAASCGVLIALWDALFIRPLEADLRISRSQVQSSQQAIGALQGQQGVMLAQHSADPNKSLQAEVQNVMSQANAVGQQLMDASQAWISPQNMVHALRSLLAGRGAVRLVALETPPPTALGEVDEENAAVERIYEHAVDVTLETDYFGLLAYLEELEGLRWRFIWDVLEYEVTEYPQARVRLRLKTLSASPQWLQVGK